MTATEVADLLNGLAAVGLAGFAPIVLAWFFS